MPKGSVDEGERPRQAAIREAEEEAGLRGVVTRKPIGRYHHVKGNGRRRVDVYLMRVTNVLERWLEDRSDAAAGCGPPKRRTACAKSCTGLFTISRPNSTRERDSRPAKRHDVRDRVGVRRPRPGIRGHHHRSLQALLPTRHHPILDAASPSSIPSTGAFDDQART